MLKKYLIKILTFLTFFSLTYQAQAESFKIGLSNGWVGSEWRTQMIDEAKEAAAAWAGEGVEIEVLVQSANVDVTGQIAHVKNFISQGVDAIIINPNSPTAFDPVFKQAKAKGVLVISTDAEVSSQDAVYVGIDQKGWAAKSAKWLAEQLNGSGKVVAINGFAGHPANQMRVDGYTEVFNQYANIEIIAEVNANWDQAQGQQAMQTLLATYPDIDGVWVQDGMAVGAWRAISDAGRDSIIATGEIRRDFFESWKVESYKTGASVNPPGVMASALNVAVHMMLGKDLKSAATDGVYGNAIYIPIPFVDGTNFDTVYNSMKDEPGYYSYSEALTIADTANYFN